MMCWERGHAFGGKAQGRLLNAKFGHAWVEKHHFGGRRRDAAARGEEEEKKKR